MSSLKSITVTPTNSKSSLPVAHKPTVGMTTRVTYDFEVFYVTKSVKTDQLSTDVNLPNNVAITRFARVVHRLGNVQTGDREQAEINEKQLNAIERTSSIIRQYRK